LYEVGLVLSHTREKPGGEKDEMREKLQHHLQIKSKTSVQYNQM